MNRLLLVLLVIYTVSSVNCAKYSSIELCQKSVFKYKDENGGIMDDVDVNGFIRISHGFFTRDKETIKNIISVKSKLEAGYLTPELCSRYELLQLLMNTTPRYNYYLTFGADVIETRDTYYKKPILKLNLLNITDEGTEDEEMNIRYQLFVPFYYKEYDWDSEKKDCMNSDSLPPFFSQKQKNNLINLIRNY